MQNGIHFCQCGRVWFSVVFGCKAQLLQGLVVLAAVCHDCKHSRLIGVMPGKRDSSLARSTVSAAKRFLVLQRRGCGMVQRCAHPRPSLVQVKPCDGSPWVSRHSVLHAESSGGSSSRH